MAGRGPRVVPEEGGRGRGGRGTPGRGGRSGSFASTPPPPPPPGGGRGGRGSSGQAPSGGYSAGTPFRAPSPGRGVGGRGGRAGLGYTPSPQQQGRGRGQSPAGNSGCGGASPFSPASAGGRSYGGRGSPAASGSSPGGFPLTHGGVGVGRVWGRGAEAVAWDRDKERTLLKVGPPAGQRFSATWLRGLTSFVAWRYQQLNPEQLQQQGAAPLPPPEQRQHQQEAEQPETSAEAAQQSQQGSSPPVTVERPPTATPARPSVTVERLPATGGVLPSGSERLEGELATAGSAAELAAGASCTAESSHMGGGDSDEAEEADLLAAGGSGANTPSSSSSDAGSDLGWASVLASAAAAAASGSAGSSGGSGGTDAGSQGAGTPNGRAAGGSSASDGGEGDVTSPGSCRHWWPASPASLAEAQPVAVELQPATGQAGPLPGGSRVQLSLRLERMALTDREAGMLADWCCEQAGSVEVKKLWLFDNRLGDEGAAAVARILESHPGMLEVHLSHNMLGLAGATALLEALPVPPAVPAAAPGEGQPAVVAAATAVAAAGRPGQAPASQPALKPVWLRLEWNRISLEGLMRMLEEQHVRRGLLVDLPTAIRADAAPSLPDLPPYLATAAAEAPAAPTAAPASRGTRNALQFVIDRCHARLPWVSCQFQLPSEAAVLKAVRSSWRSRQQPEGQSSAGQLGAPAIPALAAAAEGAAGTRSSAALGKGTPAPATAASAGPLLLFPDTSALLPMLGAGGRVSTPTFFTLDLLLEMAQHGGRFGRALPEHEQVFVVVTDSVLKQLDGLKNDPAARPAIRRFLGQGLDTCGPAGADFLTVLGAHEGEGLLVEHDAAVAGSRSSDNASKGQQADQRIVEVALFFQQEVLREAPPTTSASASGASGVPNASPGSGASSLSAASFPVLLLSGDNAQVQTARSHGLPAARMSDLLAAQPQLEAAIAGQRPLSASLLRACLGAAAVTGLGAVATRSLQADFDGAVSMLGLATEALVASQRQLVAAGIKAGVDPQLLPALQARLAEWQQRVASHADPSRLLRWAGGNSGTGGAGAE